MKTWTVDEMMAEEPCSEYTREVIEHLWKGRERLSLVEILNLDIPSADKMWVVFRQGALTKEQTINILNKIVTRAVIDHALHCEIKKVEKLAKRWMSGNYSAWGVEKWAKERITAVDHVAWAVWTAFSVTRTKSAKDIAMMAASVAFDAAQASSKKLYTEKLFERIDERDLQVLDVLYII